MFCSHFDKMPHSISCYIKLVFNFIILAIYFHADYYSYFILLFILMNFKPFKLKRKLSVRKCRFSMFKMTRNNRGLTL